MKYNKYVIVLAIFALISFNLYNCQTEKAESDKKVNPPKNDQAQEKSAKPQKPAQAKKEEKPKAEAKKPEKTQPTTTTKPKQEEAPAKKQEEVKAAEKQKEVAPVKKQEEVPAKKQEEAKAKVHNHDHHHEHDHHHDHDDHHHGHDHKADSHSHAECINKNESIYISQLKHEFSKFINSYDKMYHGYIGAAVISLIPIPILIIILVFGLKKVFCLNLLSAFSAGSLLGDVLFHNLAEILGAKHSHSHNSCDSHYHSQVQEIVIKTNNNFLDTLLTKEMFICYGVVLSFLFQKFLSGGGHDHSSSTCTSPGESKVQNKHWSDIALSFFNDFLHNFTDGIAIAASFRLSFNLGVVNLLAISLHEIPHEVADFSFLLKRGKSAFFSLFNQLLAASGAFLGVYLSKFLIKNSR